MKRIVLAAGALATGFAALARSAFEGVWNGEADEHLGCRKG